MKPDRSALILAAAIACLGLFPHLYFSLSMGELMWFKGAYDEDYYTLAMLDEEPRQDRIISTGLFRSFIGIHGGSLDLAQMTSDTLLTFVCVMAAYFCASGITRDRKWRWVLTLSLLFGSDLLVTTNQAVNSSFSTRTIRSLLPPAWQQLLPITDSSYFQLFRTPEPQTSWLFFFLFISFLSRKFSVNGIRLKAADWLILVLFLGVFPYVYIFLVIPSLILLSFVLIGRVFRGGWLPGLALIVVMFLALLWFIVWSPIGSVGTILHVGFPSRVPSITPALLLAACLSLLEIWTGKPNVRLPSVWFGLSALAVPIVLLNQQIVTGIMTSARDWERYSCYVLVIFGCCHLQSMKHFFQRVIEKRKFMPVLILGMFFFVLIRGQFRNHGEFGPYNRLSVAQWRVIQDVVAKTGTRDFRVLIDNQYFGEPLLQVRSYNTLEFTHSYTELLGSPILGITLADSAPAGRSHHQEKAFESLAREGISPGQLLSQMRDDIKFNQPFHRLIAFFALKDCYRYYTDDRGISNLVLLKQIDEIVADYKEYLQTGHASWNSPVVYVSAVKPDEAINDIWTNQVVASRVLEGERRISRLYGYVQKLKHVSGS